MKNLIGILLLFFSFQLSAQTVQESWASLLSQKKLATYFSGMWEKLGITVEETKEQITVIHKGDHFELKDGIDENNVDYSVVLKLENITKMVKHGADGEIGEYESFRIMGTLFTSFARSSLTHPMMNKSFLMKLAHIENHAHVYLNSPTNDEFFAHTILFVNKKWMVIEGIHGDAKRVFKLNPEQAIVYQREAFAAQKGDTKKSWRKFKKFYLKWRNTVSTVVQS